MKNITLEKLILTNFKGIRSQEIDFSHRTTISGENATGKTTLFDAFFWLLFDKNSENKTVFEIKTLDSNNNPIHNLEHNVTGVFLINDLETTFSKTYKEKWTRRRGQQELELTGHETIYSINGVEIAAGEYKKRIAEIIDEKVFMLITNPLQFSQAQGWKERREVIMKILGEISNEEVINADPESLKPLKELFEKRTYEELQKITKSTKSKLNDELKFIPERIKEVDRSKIEPIPESRLLKERKLYQERIFDLEEGMRLNTIQDQKKAELLKKKYDLMNEESCISRQIVQKQDEKLDSKKAELKTLLLKQDFNDKNYRMLMQSIMSIKMNAQRIDSEIAEIGKRWFEEKDKKFTLDQNDTVCPTCHRPFDGDQISEKIKHLEEAFNITKSEALERIVTKGKELRKEQDKYKEQLKNEEEKAFNLAAEREKLESDLLDITEEIDELKESNSDEENPEIVNLKNKKEALQNEIKEIEENIKSIEMTDGNHFKSEIMNQKEKIAEIDKELAKASWNEQADKRIAELENELQEKTDAFNKAERTEFLLEEFLKTKVRLLESRINERFSKVQFKLFNNQVNGGITETCEALIDGVPFADANKASKINAGLDIINTLNDYYETLAPIWIDNRESINEVLETKAQLINLVVSKDPILTIKKEN